MQNTQFTSPDEYISAQPELVQPMLQQMRTLIRKAAPDAQEAISYGMPAFKQNGVLVFYAAWKSHLGFYPSGSGIADFETELRPYKTSKGAIQFPLDQPLPAELIAKIVKFRVAENAEKAALSAIAKKK